MSKIDFYPSQCSFQALANVAFTLISDKSLPADSSVSISISHTGQLIHSETIMLTESKDRYLLPIKPGTLPFNAQGKGFLATCQLISKGKTMQTLHTAFDCDTDWTAHPRYGFLCDFPPERQGAAETIESLLKFHINGLQFYDWQYRHEQLFPAQPIYEDILGRQLSLPVIRNLIAAAHQAGMACMPYLAIYGASLAYWKAHQDSALYNAAGRAITFHDFMGLMNPSPESDWTTHLSDECQEVLAELPFDGLHVDQYGEPQKAFNHRGELVDLPAAFVDFVDKQKESHQDMAVVFNAVKNWPIEAMCTSQQDFMYIEIWPPAVHYQDLLEIIRNAQQLSGNKPVVLALYIPVNRSANIRLSNAVIMASGAARIELGEDARYLSNPYFPKHQAIPPGLYKSLRRYYDFAVGYREWLKPSNPAQKAIAVNAPQDVVCLTNDLGNRKIVHLINFSQLAEKRWDRRHNKPQSLQDFQIQIPLKAKAIRVSCASPDEKAPYLKPVAFNQIDNSLSVTIPNLQYWSMVSIETEESQP